MNGLDEATAHDVAEWFLAIPSRPEHPMVHAAYRALEAESDEAFVQLTAGHVAPPIRVVFTSCRVPYESDRELIDAVRQTRELEVVTSDVERDRPHPVLGTERGGAYDRFRAVHDLIGHAYFGLGFDRHGEYSAWRAQEQTYSPLAQLALATELHAEHSVRWTTSQLAEHKAALMPADLLARARRGAAPADLSTR